MFDFVRDANQMHGQILDVFGWGLHVPHVFEVLTRIPVLTFVLW